jgi:heterodisulfide reductase subunit A
LRGFGEDGVRMAGKATKRTVRGKVESGAGCAGKPERPRIAVIVCDCGGEISGALDMEALVKAAKALPGVAMVRRGSYPCSRTEVGAIAGELARAGIERVVVAGCSERLFGRYFRTHLAAGGIQPAFVEFADIKHHAAAVHRGARAAATAKAARLVSMAVVEVAGARAPERLEAAVTPVCAILGGGITGITAAIALAFRGVSAVLVEKQRDLGGLLNRLNVVYPNHVAAAEFVRVKREELEGIGARVITGVSPVAVRGHVGDFEIDLSDGQTVKAGAIIVATGADLLVPEGLFGYGTDKRVITQMDLEAMLVRGEDPGRNIVMIQCAGSRNQERPYCSRVCCTASIVNTIVIKQRLPEAKITVLSRGFAEYAGDLDKAREMGVEIIRYSPERPPVVKQNAVEVFDEISEMEATIPFDRVVLAVPMVPSRATAEVAGMLRMPTDSFGFLMEPRLKVRPEELAQRGIFAAGCAHWPSTITESIAQAYGAASRAFDLINSGRVMRESVVASIDADLCRGCGRCVEACRHGAIDLVTAEDGIKQAAVIPIQCTGCGVCVSVCPSGAATLPAASAEIMAPVIDAIVGGRH